MRTRQRQKPLLILTAFLVGVFVLGQHINSNDTSRNPAYVRFQIFGTFGEVMLYGKQERTQAAAKAIVTRLQKLHDTTNLFDAESELSQLNATAYEEPFECNEELWRLVQQARRGYRLTDGAFDITVAPLMALWGFHGQRDGVPSAAELAPVRRAVGLNTVLFNPDKRSVRFTHPYTAFDMGGIVKGYGLDLAAEIAAEHGINAGLINLGGNIRALGVPEGRRGKYRIGVRHPRQQDEVMGRVNLENTCVATSGDYEKMREVDGEMITHIIDPRSGHPVRNRLSVTVVTPHGIDSDMFSTAVFVGGTRVAYKLSEWVPNTRFLIVERHDDGDIVRRKIGWRWADEEPSNWFEKARDLLSQAI